MNRFPLKRSFWAVTCLVALFLASCQEDGDDEDVTPAGGHVSVFINGDSIAFSDSEIRVSQGYFRLKTSGNQEHQIDINLPRGLGEGVTFPIGVGLANFLYNNTLAGINGVVKITEINEEKETISGTFLTTIAADLNHDGITGNDEKLEFSQGVFTDVPYTIQMEITGTTNVAKVDGADFTAEVVAMSSKGLNDTRNFQITCSAGYEILYLTFPVPNKVTSDQPYTFDLGELNPEDTFYGIEYINGLYTYTNISGNITITSYDVATKHIEGTFETTVQTGGNTIAIKQGKISTDDKI